MLISPLAQKLTSVSDTVQILLYADDLLIIVTGEPAQAVFVFLIVWGSLKAFSKYSGLMVNHKKSAILLKGHWTESLKVQLLSTGLQFQDSYKYLGIEFGHVTPEVAYSHALQKAMGRAFAMQSWDLSLAERVLLLKLWILPLLIYPARVVFPSDPVVSALRTVYQVALKLNSWSITLDILSHPLHKGGYNLAAPETFLYWQHASALVAYVKDPLSVPSILHTSFQPFAADLGIILSPASLPFFQLGPNVVKQTMPFLGWCARAFSLVKKDVHFEHPAQLPGDAPAWHSTFFLNEHCHTYFSPRLIRQGVLTIGQLLEQPTYFSMLAPTWEPVYRHRLQVDQPLLPASLLPTFALPPQPPPDLTFWYAWTRAPVAELFSQPYSLKPRQPDSVWEAFHRCNLPPRHKDFIHKALWSRLPVGQRQQSWKPLEVWCPVDQELETVAHTLYHCQFVQKSFAFINQVFRPEGFQPFNVSQLSQEDPAASLSTPAGFVGWSAVITNWSLRCTKKHQPFFRVTWDKFCDHWYHVLNLWSSCPRYLPIPDTIHTWFLTKLRRSSRSCTTALPTAEQPDPVPSFPNNPPTPPPTRAKARATARQMRKLEKAEELQEVLQDLQDRGIPRVYTDGSSAVEGPAGRLAGYGIFCGHHTSIAAYVPDEYRQTNNSAELLTVIRALKIFHTGDIALCTDSQYVILGASGAARRWRLRGWVGSSGPVSIVPLWEQLLMELDNNSRTVHWIKVPSHVTIEGNNEADRLADQGRQLHPRYPHPSTPQLQLCHTGTPAAPKRVKLSSLEATSPVVKRLDFPLHESPLRATSAEGHHLLTALNLTLLSDGGVSTPSNSDSDTDTWNTSGEASSQPSVQSCSTEASR